MFVYCKCRREKAMVKIDGKKLTPNQLAKRAIVKSLELAYYFREDDHDLWDAMTDREKAAFNAQVEKRIASVMRCLGAIESDGAYAEWMR